MLKIYLKSYTIKLYNTPALLMVCISHFISHVHIMVIPALLPLIPEALQINYVDIGFAIGTFNVVSALSQAPLGYATDKYGSKNTIIFGLLIGSSSYLLLSLFPSKLTLVAVMGFAGFANGTYHPSNYALLSKTINQSKMGRAFSVHSFSGYAGAAITPATLITIAVYTNVSWAIGFASFLGLLSILFFMISKNPTPSVYYSSIDIASNQQKPKILSPAVIILAFLFLLLSLSTATLERFSATVLIQGHGISLGIANMALTAFLICSATGVLCGGSLADKTKKHGYIASFSFALAIILLIPVNLYQIPSLPLISIFAMIGFLTGIIVPSRDMMVREASPKGSEGKTFGIVTSGFNVGSAIGPVVFGYLLDNRLPTWIFWGVVITMVMTVMLTLFQETKLYKKL